MGSTVSCLRFDWHFKRSFYILLYAEFTKNTSKKKNPLACLHCIILMKSPPIKKSFFSSSPLIIPSRILKIPDFYVYFFLPGTVFCESLHRSVEILCCLLELVILNMYH